MDIRFSLISCASSFETSRCVNNDIQINTVKALEKRLFFKRDLNRIESEYSVTVNKAPLHALHGFVTAAKAANLSKAAAQMHVTVSALSHQIKSLESHLGYRVFQRGPRGISLTEEGRRLFERVSPHLEAVDAAVRAYTARRDEKLTISLLPSMASAWLVPRLGPFLAQHPQLELSLDSDWSPVDFAVSPHIDAALRSGNGDWKGLHVEHLFDETLIPVASPDFVKRHGSPSLDTLHRFPLLGDPSAQWDHWFLHFKTEKPDRYVAHVNDSETLHRAAVEGVGIALARMTRARLLVDSGLLVTLTRQSLQTGSAHHLVYPERSASHRGLLLFRAWLLREAKVYTGLPLTP